MKSHILRRRLISCAMVVLCGGPAAAQAPTPAPDQAAVLAAARVVMKAAQHCTLVTVDDGGHPHIRIMDPPEPTADFTIWLGTNSASRKVAHIRGDPRVALNYFDRATMSYVTLTGSAILAADPAEKTKGCECASARPIGSRAGVSVREKERAWLARERSHVGPTM